MVTMTFRGRVGFSGPILLSEQNVLSNEPGTAGYTVAYSQGPTSPSDIANSNRFGRSLSLTGNSMVIGMVDPTGSYAGAAYVWDFDGLNWNQTAKFTGPNAAGNQFGYAVGIAGDYCAIGEPFGDTVGGTVIASGNRGNVRLFKRTSGFWNTTAAQVLESPSNPNQNQFGFSLAMTEDTLVVGAPADNGSVTGGRVYVYVLSGSTWTLQATLQAPTQVANAFFGWSVELVGNLLLVGEPGRDTNRGAVYAFTRSGTTWSAPTTIVANPRTDNANFGYSLRYKTGRLVVGAPGSRSQTDTATSYDGGHVFLYSGSGTSWTQEADLKVATSYSSGVTLVDPNFSQRSRLGWHVDIHDTKNVIIAGAFRSNGGGSVTDSGAVYVFERVNHVWGPSALPSVSAIRQTSPVTSDMMGYQCRFHSGDPLVTTALQRTTLQRGAFYYYK